MKLNRLGKAAKNFIGQHTALEWGERGLMMAACGNVIMATLPGGFILNAVHLLGCGLIASGATVTICEGVDAFTEEMTDKIVAAIDGDIDEEDPA